MIGYWFVTSMFFSMFLREVWFDFSTKGAAYTFFFFLWPGEPILLIFPPRIALLGAVLMIGILVAVSHWSVIAKNKNT